MESQVVKVTNKGMITIPAKLRKKHNIKDGDRVAVIEDENGIRLVKLADLDELRKISYTSKELKKMMEESREEDLEMEY
ncbi:MAG: AbrB/MazE/SpoVT family DNA-binding domain-containing protein [Promethearchaeota archaeon]